MSRIAYSFLVVILAAAGGCFLENNGDGDGGGGGGGGGGGAVIPREGTWTYAEYTKVSSNCPGIVDQTAPGEFEIVDASSGGFRVIPEDGSDPFACTATGASYSCPDRAAHVESVPGRDAVVTMRATADGTFTSASAATGRQQATVSCAGSDCGTLGGLPCAFTVDYVVRAQ